MDTVIQKETARLNYYQILGIPRTASQKEVTRAYRRLAQKFHPDLHAPEQKLWAEEQMKRLNEAYEILNDPVSRASYDVSNNQFAGPTFTKRPTPSYSTSSSTASPPYTPSRRGRPRKWQKYSMLADFVLWFLVFVFLVAGYYMIDVEWALFDNLVHVEKLTPEWIFAAIWYAVFIITLLKMVPLRR